MAESKLDKPTVYRKVRHAVRLAQEEEYENALLLFEMYLPLLSPDNDDEVRLLAMASSHCGLCVAKVRHHYTEALEYCRVSLSRDNDPDHRANTALIYLQRGDRRRAIRHLFAGLKARPDHARILGILQRIGTRRPPVLRFLKRGHPLNVLLGKMRARHTRRNGSVGHPGRR
jgi:tetratricopeptide (TPR) repeat protein